jgi:rhodanese-related sulfurtransferase
MPSMSVNTQATVKALAKDYSPFIHLPVSVLPEAERAMRFFELNPGEEIRISARKTEGYLYLVDGDLTIGVGEDVRKLHVGDEGKMPIQLAAPPCRVSVIADTPAILCQIESEDLDLLMSWQELATDHDLLPGHQIRERFHQVQRSCLAFAALPLDCVEQALDRMKSVAVKAGDDVVTQGEPADAFYVVVEGEADVWCVGIYDDEPRLVNQLRAGSAFGEEALILAGSRTATVRMRTDGELLRLEKEDFDELIAGSQIETVSALLAKSMLEDGYRLLDVRYEEEFEDESIPGSILIPLPELRDRFTELDPKERYLVLCKGGKRAEVATMLLKQRRIKAATIAGGIRDWPYETIPPKSAGGQAHWQAQSPTAPINPGRG